MLGEVNRHQHMCLSFRVNLCLSLLHRKVDCMLQIKEEEMQSTSSLEMKGFGRNPSGGLSFRR